MTDTLIKEFELPTGRLEIHHDYDATSTREWDNVATMVCKKGGYDLGDDVTITDAISAAIDSAPEDVVIDIARQIDPEGFAEYLKRCKEYSEVSDFELACSFIGEEPESELWGILPKFNGNGNGITMLPLFIYDHGGITINTTGFYCGWDSGQAGWIYMTDAKAKETFGKNFTTEQIKTCLKAEVKDYDYYLTGQVYGYVLYGHPCEACGCKESAKSNDSCWGFIGENDLEKCGILDNLDEDIIVQIKEKYKDLSFFS